jgi:hypothetical protein
MWASLSTGWRQFHALGGLTVMIVHFRQLDSFFTNCFHEDWEHDFADDAAAIRYYLDIALPEQVEGVRTELDAMLALAPRLSEDDLETVLTFDLGCSYDPTEDGLTRANWLRSVRARLE